MSSGEYAQLAAALLSGSILPIAIGFLWRRLRRDPKADAETRLDNAKASRIEWETLRDEVNRLTDIVRDQGKQIEALKKAAEVRIGREAALENENRHLRTLIGRLRRRVEGLEKILKIEVKITPEMQKLLDELPDDDASEREVP